MQWNRVTDKLQQNIGDVLTDKFLSKAVEWLCEEQKNAGTISFLLKHKRSVLGLASSDGITSFTMSRICVNLNEHCSYTFLFSEVFYRKVCPNIENTISPESTLPNYIVHEFQTYPDKYDYVVNWQSFNKFLVASGFVSLAFSQCHHWLVRVCMNFWGRTNQ